MDEEPGGEVSLLQTKTAYLLGSKSKKDFYDVRKSKSQI